MLKKALLAVALTTMSLSAENRIFELRTYTAVPGKLDNVVARFRDHTVKLFEKHGMQNIGYWVAKDQPDTLIYIVAHKDREAAKASWDAFRKDPVWTKARDASEVGGKIVAKVDSVFMDAVDFSKIK
jgi:NIPSNAP